MRHKLALTVALAILMAVVAGGSMAGAASTASSGTAGTGSGEPTTPASPTPPVVVPGTPIGGGGVQAAPPLSGAINAPPENGGSGAPGIGSNSEQTAPTPSGGASSGAAAAPGTPSTSFAPIGPSPLGVPNFVIESFEIPPFLLPIYQACGTQYDIPWQVLASINKIETAFGTNLNVSSAGAEGWMQFIPSTWATYGVDANGDGLKDPYNPVDAICAAARYLKAAGGETDIYNAILAYNHADWYAQEVLLYARAYTQLPDSLVSSLTGLTEGAHFPVAAKARYVDAISTAAAKRNARPSRSAQAHNAAQVVGSSPGRTGIDIYSKQGAPVVAVNDGVIKAIGSSPALGRYIVLQDAYGNRYTYGQLGEIVSDYPVPKPRPLTAKDFKLITPPADKKPSAPATNTTASDNALNTLPHSQSENEGSAKSTQGDGSGAAAPGTSGTGQTGPAGAPTTGTAAGGGPTGATGVNGTAGPTGATGQTGAGGATGATGSTGATGERGQGSGGKHPPKVIKPSVKIPAGAAPGATDTGGKDSTARQRAYALPSRPAVKKVTAHGANVSGTLAYSTFSNYYNDVYAYNSKSSTLRPLKVGSSVIGGTVLGRIGSSGGSPHVNFGIRPAGKNAPQIDPKPILDGWKLLEATAIYGSNGKNRLKSSLGVGGVLLLSKSALQRRVLNDPRLSIYSCGRNDIATGQIDRRILAAMEYLVEKGFRLSITSLKCGHSFLTSSGNVSEHTTGDAMDIAVINGVPVTGHQGPGTLSDALIRALLQLQGTMAPHQIISLEDLPGPQSFALPDHYDHVHVGYMPEAAGSTSTYQYPFLNAVQGRVDQGVDFTGVGPILAIGRARVIKTGAPGWPVGGGVLYQLLDGPRAGQFIFVNEGVTATVHAGQTVAAGQQIATFLPGSSIEIGFADSAGTPLSHAVYHEGDVTPWGRRMEAFLSDLSGAGGGSLLTPDQWNRLIKRLGQIQNPTVPVTPSSYALRHRGSQNSGKPKKGGHAGHGSGGKRQNSGSGD